MLSTVVFPVGRKNELNLSLSLNGLVPAPPFDVHCGSLLVFQRATPKPPCQNPGVHPPPHGAPTTVAVAVSLAEVLAGSSNAPDAVTVLVTVPLITHGAVNVCDAPGPS